MIFAEIERTPHGYTTIDTNKTTGEQTTTRYYYLRDHLGSNRVVFRGDGTVVQQNHYYAYGGLTAESTGGTQQSYKYNGKEFDRKLGLDLYDYGARWYAPVGSSSFTTVDPLCEKYYSVSPYAYCANNPINAIDPDGEKVVNNKGYILYYINKQGHLSISTKASPYERMLYEGLMLTPTGRTQLRQMINNKIVIHLVFKDWCKTDDVSHITYAETMQGRFGSNNGIYKENGRYKITDATITFYMNSINESLNDKQSDNYGYTLTEALGAEGSHEAVHASDPNEIHLDILSANGGKSRSTKESEVKPNQVEQQFRKELEKERLAK